MRHFIYIFALVSLLTAVSCAEDGPVTPGSSAAEGPNGGDAPVPESYFVATFTAAADTRAAVTGMDTRIQHLRYMVFDADDESFVKERLIPINPGGQLWPLSNGVISDTLPAGNYKAVFLGNVDPSLFAFDGDFDVLTGYEDGYDEAEILLPPVAFTDNTEYYMAQAEFSTTYPSSEIILQRIISRLDVYRDALDIDDAVDSLAKSIVDNIKQGDLLTETVRDLLYDDIEPILSPVLLLTGQTDVVVNALIDVIIGPLLDYLYNALLEWLVADIGNLLVANSGDSAGLLEFLTIALNPWGTSNFENVVVTINNFPRSVNFDREVVDFFAGENKFAFSIAAGSIFNQKTVPVKSFADPNGVYDILEVNVVADDLLLLNGVVVDEVVDSLLLNDALLDIGDPLSEAPGIDTVHHGINKFYGAGYSIVDLGLNSYQDSGRNTEINIKLGDVLNLDDLLDGLTSLDLTITVLGIQIGLLDWLLDTLSSTLDVLLNDVLDLTITIPVQFPMVGVNNLTLSGGWSVVDAQQ